MTALLRAVPLEHGATRLVIWWNGDRRSMFGNTARGLGIWSHFPPILEPNVSRTKVTKCKAWKLQQTQRSGMGTVPQIMTPIMSVYVPGVTNLGRGGSPSGVIVRSAARRSGLAGTSVSGNIKTRSADKPWLQRCIW